MMLNELLEQHGITIPDHLTDQAEIPVLTCLQMQGDVAIIPTRPSAKKGTPIPPEGIPVVRGENGGNTHLLVGTGSWAPSTDEYDLGVVTVPEDAVGWLLHPEHGGNAFGPGAYRLRRQREQREAIRRVAD